MSRLLLRPRFFSNSTFDPRLGLGFPHAEPPSELGLGLAPPPPSKPTPPPLLPCPSADALAGILVRHHNPFHPSESSLQLAGTLVLTDELVLQTLVRLRNHSKVAVAFFLWARDHAGHAHSADAYDLLVDVLGKVRQFDAAWKVTG